MANSRGRKLGYIVTAETKRKISESRKGQVSSMRGKKHSTETKQKMSKAAMGNKYGLGHHVSDEIKKRISDGNKGKKRTEEARKKMSKNNVGMKGKKHSEETKEKMRKAQCREKHSQWRGGSNQMQYGIEFNNNLREIIRERGNHTCQECKYPQEQLSQKLSIHHIDYDKKNNNMDNLISLCLSCHTKTNFNRDDWTKYYKERAAI